MKPRGGENRAWQCEAVGLRSDPLGSALLGSAARGPGWAGTGSAGSQQLKVALVHLVTSSTLHRQNIPRKHKYLGGILWNPPSETVRDLKQSVSVLASGTCARVQCIEEMQRSIWWKPNTPKRPEAKRGVDQLQQFQHAFKKM
ncbi:Hypothetical predicted protein [Olea europaea subsp. europaea]|uniref:Uncharacterized protein n=1 Tax=Olea europaea subsp. europaea TaxID=158383 RepID=A0A8S0UGE3_OLEEU|nr:Hypothetical predicted protein [Olea europaea subsp. europaea]